MADRSEYWRVRINQLRMAQFVNWAEADAVAKDIARASTSDALREAAERALPLLRRAVAESDDRDVAAAALRCLGSIVEAMNGQAAPRFGQRSAPPARENHEDHARKALGLPLVVQLSHADVNQAYRRMVKIVHPDHGGSEQAFLELTAARDALIARHL
ncbi:MAG: J domain-containing protein [Alphaproteobacteria bacterium]|nr:J domain-containing protein [Alphaproteobacteria bacterium]